MLRRLLRGWPLVGLLIITMAAAGACAAEEFGEEADSVLEELEQTGTLTAPVEFDGEVLIYPEDVEALLEEVNSIDTVPDKREGIRDYLKKQKLLNCIQDKIGDALKDEKDVNCEGKELVDKKDVAGLLEDIEAQGSNQAKRDFLRVYIYDWEEEQRVSRVVEGLAQMKRTRAIPVFGKLISAIHRFPISYEGDELVPKADLDDLLAEFKTLRTDEDREKLVDDYLRQREGTSP